MSDLVVSKPASYFGIIVHPNYTDDGSELVYAEIEPAYSRWRPWPGRTSRWWYEIHSEGQPDEHGISGSTYAYIEHGSGGGFTFRACVRRAQRAVDYFTREYPALRVAREDRQANVNLYGAEHIAELEKEANR